MQTPIAQAAALTIYGNDLLRGYAQPNFWSAATVFRFCKRVRFFTLDSDPDPANARMVAKDPAEWVARLREAGTSGFRLHHLTVNNPRISDRMSVGFVGGGGRWLIETRHAAHSDIWEAAWRVDAKDDPDRKIWDVAYRRVEAARAHLPLTMRRLAALKSDLALALSRIEAFATRMKLELFAQAFRAARDALTSDAPFAGAHHPDLAPALDVPLAARQLLASAQFAWVFGGMGSWNDQGFEGQDQQDYDQLSDDLFALLNEAVCGAVNSTAPA